MPETIHTILNDVKKFVSGIDADVTDFDDTLTMFINSIFVTLHQLGVGPTEGFEISTGSENWTDFISDNMLLRNIVKDYVCAKAQIEFDPPTQNVLMEALKARIAECEWRINNKVDYEN